MNSQIMNLSSGYIYGGELLAAESCANHSLDGYSTSGSETQLFEDTKKCLIWFDTTVSKFGEEEEQSKNILGTGEQPKGKKLPSILETASKLNKGEASLIEVLYKDLRES